MFAIYGDSFNHFSFNEVLGKISGFNVTVNLDLDYLNVLVSRLAIVNQLDLTD